jgi:hypothetical protein
MVRALSLQNEVKNKVLEYMKDGKCRNVDEIREYVVESGIKLDNGTSALRMALFNLKKENLAFKNVKKGFYQMDLIGEKNKTIQLEMNISEKTGNKTKNIETIKINMKYDFRNFETIKEATRKETALVVSIMEDGTIALNAALLHYFPNRKAEIKLKNDGTELALVLDGEDLINLGKNGRTKNYYIVEKLKEKNHKLPMYYSGRWDEEYGVWLGKKTNTNPNKIRK